MAAQRSSRNDQIPSSYLNTPDGQDLVNLLSGFCESRQAPSGQPAQSYAGWSPFSGGLGQGYHSGWEPSAASGLCGDASASSGQNVGHFDDLMSRYTQPMGSLDPGSAGGYFSYYGGSEENLDFDQAASNGQSVYAAAMNQWNGYEGLTYNPFNSPGHLMQDLQGQEDTNSKNEDAAPINDSTSRPSYSEVAKNAAPTSGNQPVKPDSNKKAVPKHPATAKPDSQQGPGAKTVLSQAFKKHRSKGQRSVVMKGKHGDIEGSRVLPNSRYGLDDFEEDFLKKPRSNSGDSNSGSRKGSSSSVSSGIDELLLTHASNSPAGSSISSSSASKLNVECDDFPPEHDSTSSNSFSNTLKTQSCKSGKAASPAAANSSTSTTRPKQQQQQQQQDIFFDPRRIFNTPKETKSRKTQTPTSPEPQRSSASMRNNNSLTPPVSTTGGSGLNNDNKHKIITSQNCSVNTKTKYINNDLRDKSDSKRSVSSKYASERSKSNDVDAPKNVNYEHSKHRNISGGSSKKRSKENLQSHLHRTVSQQAAEDKTSQCQEYLELVSQHLKLWWSVGTDWGKWLVAKAFILIVAILIILVKLSIEIVKFSYHLAIVILIKVKEFCVHKWCHLRSKYGSRDHDWSNTSSQTRHRTYGLEENIPLPSTGNEAMKRLLAGKGKDPYSILGLRCDASDENIKKYYRKQAVLVHPDKNQQPGAEEAFKILKHAFEIIGEPEKRRQYDSQRLEASEAENAWKEFADMLTKLRDKMQEAANTMRCDNCGGKHARLPTDRPWYSARQCDRCNTRHSAKEGDVWAESTMLGFLWHYYACMEGNVYDITEWAKCQNNHFKHMQSNVHHVMYRIATNANRRQHQAAHSSEAELNDFLNNLFHHGGPPCSPDDLHQRFNQSNTSTNSSTASAQSRKKRKKRR